MPAKGEKILDQANRKLRDEAMVYLYVERRASIPQLSAIFGLSYQRTQAIVGGSRRPEDYEEWRQIGNTGELNPNSKLTEEDVREILREFKFYPETESEALAEKYGVSLATIRSVRQGRSWRHVYVDVMGIEKQRRRRS